MIFAISPRRCEIIGSLAALNDPQALPLLEKAKRSAQILLQNTPSMDYSEWSDPSVNSTYKALKEEIAAIDHAIAACTPKVR